MPAQDYLTSAEVGITGDHSYIHSGKAFSFPVTVAALAAAGISNIGFTTPAASGDNPQIHWRPTEFSSSANSARIRLYQGSAFTGGTLKIPRNRNQSGSYKADRSVINPKMVIYTGVTAALTNTVIVNASAGGGFANQPTGDGIEVLSDNAADVGIGVTFYGTKTGVTTTVTTETVSLNGLTFVPTVLQTWQNLLGVELSAACVGTITIREASANATIITIAAGTLSAGVVTPSSTKGYDEVPRHDASAATTAPVGIIGTYYDGTALSSVDALNGTTEEDHNAVPFKTITKVLIGAVAADRTVSILVPDHIVDALSVGSGSASNRSGGAGGANQEIVLEPNTSYVLNIVNTGAVTTTDVDINLFYYEETY
jgi:hypothetical protein